MTHCRSLGSLPRMQHGSRRASQGLKYVRASPDSKIGKVHIPAFEPASSTGREQSGSCTIGPSGCAEGHRNTRSNIMRA